MRLRPFHVAVAFAIAVCASGSVLSQSNQASTNDDRRIISTVQTMFRAISINDRELFNSVTDSDFYLFDAGARLNGDSVLPLLQTMKENGKSIEWNVTEPDVHVDGNAAWIAYVDRGSEIEPTGRTNMTWLESAFLVKRNSQWKIAFMQSTPVSDAVSTH